MLSKNVGVVVWGLCLSWSVTRADLFLPQLLDQFQNLPSAIQGLPSDYELKEGGEEFDYIVVGAGAGGAAAAARLALADRKVLLVEAGADPNPLTKIPAAAQGLLGSPIDWYYKTITNNKSCLSSKHQQCRFSRGKCLGGSTSINYMMYVRGNRNDYNYNIPGWTWKELEPYFLRYEALRSELPDTSKPYHNTTGIMDIEFFADSENKWHGKLFEGYENLNIPYNEDVNAESQIGVSQVIGYTYEGTRMSSARAYLTNDEVKRRLKVTKNSFCTELLWEDGDVPAVKGVMILKNGKNLSAIASKSVVVSAGAIGSPVLLQQSGVGPASLLSSLGIPVRADLPVGEQMSDHVLPLLFVKVDRSLLTSGLDLTGAGVDAARYLLTQTGRFASNGLTDVTTLLNTKCYDFHNKMLVNNSSECEEPTLQIIHAYINRGLIPIGRPLVKRAMDYDDRIINHLCKVNEEAALIVISVVVLQPESRGWVKISNTDPLKPPAIFPNYLAERADVDEMLRGIQIIQDLLETSPFKEQKAELVKFDLDCGEMEYWECYVRHITYSVFHAAGTVAVGRVTDGEQRVLGVDRLRVADLGVLPRVPRGNTAAAALALGERVADLLLSDEEQRNNQE